MKKLKLSLLLLISSLSNSLLADAPQWQLVPEASTVKFTGTQNNAPISGEFKRFEADVKFDPNNLKESKIKLTVDMNSVAAGFEELSNMLKTADWFNVTTFPQATFESTEITQKDKGYQVKGELKVRDKTAPVVADVTLDENTANKIKLHGKAALSRTTLGVGQGEWSDTAQVRDPVNVDFSFELKR